MSRARYLPPHGLCEGCWHPWDDHDVTEITDALGRVKRLEGSCSHFVSGVPCPCAAVHRPPPKRR